jgi:hypothetical protein
MFWWKQLSLLKVAKALLWLTLLSQLRLDMLANTYTNSANHLHANMKLTSFYCVVNRCVNAIT